MKQYRNISEQWGDSVTVTIEDVKKQAVIFGLDAALVTSDDDSIYFDGEKIAERI